MHYDTLNYIHYTLSGRTGSALACIPKVARSRLTERSKFCDLQPALHYAIGAAQGVLPSVGWGVRPFNWIYRLRSWLWSTATRSSPLGYFSKLLQVVDN